MARRPSFSEKKDDIGNVVEDIKLRYERKEYYHYHDVKDVIVKSSNTNMSSVKFRITRQTFKLARFYEVLAYIVEVLIAKDEGTKSRFLPNTHKVLEEEGRGEF